MFFSCGEQDLETTAVSSGLLVHFLDYISTNMKHWWNDTDSEEHEVFGEPVSGLL
jgi:hypothetical protein